MRDWQRELRFKVGWLLLAKLAAIALIGYLFFPPSQRPPVDPAATARHLGAAP